MAVRPVPAPAVAGTSPLPRGAGVLLGIGLGGMLDGIVLHQVLQWHGMLSTRVPMSTVGGMHVNMFADGLFHAAMWLVVVAGIARLVRALRAAPAFPAAALAGDALLGWGGFNVVEGLVDHHALGLHHVLERAADPLPADLAFLAFGVLLVLAGWRIGSAARQRAVPAAER